jgi:hypothetical protein
MKLRVAILVVFVLGTVGVLMYHGLPRTPRMGEARRTSVTEPEPEIDLVTPFPADSGLKLSVLRERVLTPYRLRPDRRWLLAVSEIGRLAGAPDSAVTAEFAAGRWTLRCGSQELGRISERPDFPEVLELLTEWARAQAWRRGWSDNSGPERPELGRALDCLDAPAALREADRAWAAGARDAPLFRGAARAYAMLVLATPDWAGMTDLIAARSLACLAFARALGAEEPRREACLLAEAMGYSGTARQLAGRLPAGDPLRLYVTRDDTRLASAAEGEVESREPSVNSRPTTKPPRTTKLRAGKTRNADRATPATLPSRGPTDAPRAVRLEASFLHLLRVASRGDYATWSSLLPRFDRRGVPQALVIGTGIRIRHPDSPVVVAEKLIQAMAQRSAGRKPQAGSRDRVPGTTLAQQIQRCEAALDAQPRPKQGVLFGADITHAHERCLLYAALDRLGEQSLWTLAPTEVSRWFAAGPRKVRMAKRAAVFRRWYAHLAAARLGRPDIAAMRADVDSAAPGPAQALRSYEALRPYLASDDSSLRAAARGLVRRMDSRPEHQVELATIAGRDLVALTLAEQLGASAAAARGESDPSLRVWQERFRGDTDTLSARDTRKRRHGRGTTTAEEGLPESMAGPALARRWEADPTAWEWAERYAAWLEEHRKYTTARRVIEGFVARTHRDSSVDPTSIQARTHIARLHQLEGHPDRGLHVMGDLHRTGQFEAMERTALILQDLGQPHQALAIAWAAHRRAPHLAAGRALLAELFWHQGRHGEAARILHDGQPPLSSAAWARDVAPRFLACFRTRESEAQGAADALIKVGFSDRTSIGALSAALGAEGLDQLAFELLARIQVSGVRQLEASILAYGHLKRARGDSAALAWIHDRVSEEDRPLLALLAHQEHHPELLWSMSPERLKGERGDYHWLLRAAACMAAGPSHPRYAETAQHLERAGSSYHAEIAKYLLGQREESEILVLAQTRRQRSEIFYFMGLKAEERGRLRDAADWYLLSVESGAMDTIESRWAMQRLRYRPEKGPRPDIAPPPAPPA